MPWQTPLGGEGTGWKTILAAVHVGSRRNRLTLSSNPFAREKVRLDLDRD